VTNRRQQIGRLAESYVADRLASAGWRILERNARPAGVRGELDIVARDGRDVVFVEVKARSIGAVAGPPEPVLAVGPRKQAQLRRLASAWLREPGARSGGFAGLRFDVAGVWVGPAGEVAGWEHLRAAF
jgi:putative endonuclease